jgi:hypothetical protein
MAVVFVWLCSHSLLLVVISHEREPRDMSVNAEKDDFVSVLIHFSFKMCTSSEQPTNTPDLKGRQLPIHCSVAANSGNRSNKKRRWTSTRCLIMLAIPSLVVWISTSHRVIKDLFLLCGKISNSDGETNAIDHHDSVFWHPGALVPHKELPDSTFEFDHAFDPVPERIMNAEEIELYRSEYGLPDQPLIYFITPTYKRQSQMVDLTRLAQTLLHDRGIYWIVVEDAANPSRRVRNLLARFGLMYTHVAEPTPEKVQRKKIHPRGVNQRNRALDVVDQVARDVPGVVYFGDDDNAYDIRLFPELRKTKRASVFGVANSVGAYERCVVNPKTGKVLRIVSNWKGKRRIPMDMGGLAYHSDLVIERLPRFSNDAGTGRLETNFAEQMVDSMADLEPLAANCTHMYVWHVKTNTGNATINSQPVFKDTESARLMNLIR